MCLAELAFAVHHRLGVHAATAVLLAGVQKPALGAAAEPTEHLGSRSGAVAQSPAPEAADALLVVRSYPKASSPVAAAPHQAVGPDSSLASADSLQTVHHEIVTAQVVAASAGPEDVLEALLTEDAPEEVETGGVLSAVAPGDVLRGCVAAGEAACAAVAVGPWVAVCVWGVAVAQGGPAEALLLVCQAVEVGQAWEEAAVRVVVRLQEASLASAPVLHVGLLGTT